MTLSDFIPTIAKAVAAFVTPFVVLALGWLVERTGVELPYDPDVIHTAIVAAVTAVATYAIANRPPTSEED